ncbi:hypothetical protein B484DRAFT_431008 [Ochromonadaceae sp. CCMP2298]|nr:hypothetical protein B484DRAFT_431008 [Ochromonadaceae sp. CCMP2298]
MVMRALFLLGALLGASCLHVEALLFAPTTQLVRCKPASKQSKALGGRCPQLASSISPAEPASAQPAAGNHVPVSQTLRRGAGVAAGFFGSLAISANNPIFHSATGSLSASAIPLVLPRLAPVSASAVCTLFLSLLLPAHLQPLCTSIYCGTFAAMTCPSLLSAYKQALVLVLFCWGIHEITERGSLLPGYGGRLGISATASSSLLLTGLVLLQVQSLPALIAAKAPANSLLHIAPVFFSAMAATLLRLRLSLSPVQASAAVAATVSLSCEMFIRHGLFSSPAARATMAILPPLCVMGSFFGMSAVPRPQFTPAHAAVLASQSAVAVLLLGQLNRTPLSLVGGKLGLIAASSILLVQGAGGAVKRTRAMVSERKSAALA